MYPFNIRVYGVLIDHRGVLVSDEYIKGKYYTKFPGGGLEFGEGPIDCLVREFKEEMKLSVEIVKHLYTTDFFQISAFNNKDQIISIYYLVRALKPIRVSLKTTPFDFDKLVDQAEAFRFIPIENFSENSLTLPIDKVVATLIRKEF